MKEVIKKYQRGEYDAPRQTQKKLPKGYIFDRNLSVAQNEEMLEEYNANVDKAQQEYRKKASELVNQLREDVTACLLREYKLTSASAKVVETKAWEDGHYCVMEYFQLAESLAEFAEEILKA